MTQDDHQHDDRGRPGPKVAAHHRSGRGTARIPYPIDVRRVAVARRELVTPYLLRLTLAGAELDGFHTHAADDHVRIVFPDPDGTRRDPVPNDQQMLDWPRPLTPTRKYTVRRYDASARELDLDFVLHDGGLASDWARDIAVGEEVVVAGPPGALAFGHGYRHYVFAVDVTALPAVARWLDEADWLEQSGRTAQVVIDQDHPEEAAYPLRERRGVEVRWLDRSTGSRLAETVAALALPELPVTEVFCFAAGEAGDIRPIRRWAEERGIDALVTGYWKRDASGFEE